MRVVWNSSRSLLLFFALSIASSTSFAEEEVAAPESNPLTHYTIGDQIAADTGINFRGWLAQGITFNGEGSNYNGPVSFNDRSGEYQMNQLYFVAERAVDKTKDQFDIGGRFDMLYGTDSSFTTAVGWDDKISQSSRFYKLALPQLYAEAFIPVGNGLTIKAGHFYTLIGNEVVTAPDNFFYSHAYAMQYGEPFTHTGILASYVIADALTLTGGVTKGWDNVSDSDKGTAFLGSVGWSKDGTSVTFALTTGDEAPGLNRTAYSVVASQEFCDGWKYTFQHDFGYQEQGSAVSAGAPAQWYGVNQYLTYQYSDDLSVGGRAEWFRDDDGARVVGVRSGTGGGEADYYAFSVGLNYKLMDSVKVRPEVRYDYQHRGDSSVAGAYDAGGSINQWTSAVDVILAF